MSTEVRVPNGALGPGLRNRQVGKHELRIHDLHLRRRRAQIHERHHMRSRIAMPKASRSLPGVTVGHLVLVGRQPVVVLWVIVPIVGMRVQRGGDSRRRDHRSDEKQRQRAVHNDESTGGAERGQKLERTGLKS